MIITLRTPEVSYNWDDIDVGRFDMNDSENFFSEQHSKHEKLADIDLVRTMASTNLKEKFPMSEKVKMTPTKKKKTKSPKKVKRRSKAHPVDPEGQGNKENSTQERYQDINRPANLLTQMPELQGHVKWVVPAPVVEAPQAYNFKDIYQKKKEEKLKKVLEEEKRNRIFHSKPIPKCVMRPREMSSSPATSESQLTTPITPMVLKNSREADERRRRRIEEWRAAKNAAQRASLNKEPPKRVVINSQPQPFNLHVERRLEERKLYDEQIRRTAEQKQKQEEEKRMKREEEMIKELRKRTAFKARPNPFK